MEFIFRTKSDEECFEKCQMLREKIDDYTVERIYLKLSIINKMARIEESESTYSDNETMVKILSKIISEPEEKILKAFRIFEQYNLIEPIEKNGLDEDEEALLYEWIKVIENGN